MGLDERRGARLVVRLPGQQGQESPGDGAVGDLGARVNGGCRQHQDDAEGDDEAAGGRPVVSSRPGFPHVRQAGQMMPAVRRST